MSTAAFWVAILAAWIAWGVGAVTMTTATAFIIGVGLGRGLGQEIAEQRRRHAL